MQDGACHWVFCHSWSGMVLSAAVQADECPSPERHKISTRVPLMRNMINPNPLEFDFELPYPCGGTLVFRLVCVPADGYFDDLNLQLGCDNCGRQTQGYMEAKRTETLGGSFTMKICPSHGRTRCPKWPSRVRYSPRTSTAVPTPPCFILSPNMKSPNSIGMR